MRGDAGCDGRGEPGEFVADALGLELLIRGGVPERVNLKFSVKVSGLSV